MALLCLWQSTHITCPRNSRTTPPSPDGVTLMASLHQICTGFQAYCTSVGFAFVSGSHCHQWSALCAGRAYCTLPERLISHNPNSSILSCIGSYRSSSSNKATAASCGICGSCWGLLGEGDILPFPQESPGMCSGTPQVSPGCFASRDFSSPVLGCLAQSKS